MHHIRMLYPCFEEIASLKCLWFKATDEFIPVAQSWPLFSAEADILYTSWCLPKALRVARVSPFILHDIPTLHMHCAPINGYVWSLAHGSRFCLTPSGTSRPKNLWLTNLLSQNVIFFLLNLFVYFTLVNLSKYFWTQINFLQPQKTTAWSSTAELQNAWKSILSSFLCPAI